MKTGAFSALARTLTLAAAAGALAMSASAATFVVNSVGDESDADLMDGICLTALGTCTLRAAIEQANASAGADTIAFNIPGSGVQTISPASPLPPLTDDAGVTIDGYTQPGSSPNTLVVGDDAVLLIEIEGTNAGMSANGLRDSRSVRDRSRPGDQSLRSFGRSWFRRLWPSGRRLLSRNGCPWLSCSWQPVGLDRQHHCGSDSTPLSRKYSGPGDSRWSNPARSKSVGGKTAPMGSTSRATDCDVENNYIGLILRDVARLPNNRSCVAASSGCLDLARSGGREPV